ncbi:putative SMC domain-containing protein [Erwinia phage vB_EamM_Caitlin]|uniref:putative SMC domain-containing protein n=1 Tax=Erwinia phage vB_EamM_Caitlin TaxID=1883379 RepID=UPI00081C424B|nr:putative SMC domain-containing protein [Erwinia phage vB_EamM_Caitlin]ANZ48491.1 putative SMC domain-containing protein [Erwinia phage vB_EamM_Caitlin]
MFQVERIILKGFTGMGLHEIETFDFTIEQMTTIILGGNGCGKSSLLAVYFPIAPSKTEFVDGGSYTNYAKAGDNRYKFFVKRQGGSLVCSITDLASGALIVDGVNPKVYNARVEDLTGLNKEVKELVNGEALLTSANTETRRRWFSRLSTSDLSFALDFYKKLRKSLSLTNGAIDHTAKKVADLKMRVIDDEGERERLSQRLTELEQELAELNKAINKLPGVQMGVSAATIKAKLQQLGTATGEILAAKTLPTQLSIETALTDLNTWRELAASAEASVAAYNKELSLLLDEVNRQEYLMRNHAGLKETIDTLRVSVSNHQVENWKWGELALSDTISTPMLLKAQDDARQWSRELSGAVDYIHNHDKLRQAEENLLTHDATSVAYKEKRQRATNILERLHHERTHFLDTQEVNCPKCSFTFRPGVNDSLENIDAEIAKQNQWIREIDVALETHMTTRPEMEEDVNAKRKIRDVIMTYSRDPIVAMFFKTVQEEDAFVTNRHKLPGLIAHFIDEVKEAIGYRTHVEQLNRAQKEWEEATRAVGNVDAALEAKVKRLRGILDEESVKLTTARSGLNAAQNEYGRQQSLYALADVVLRGWEGVEQDIETSCNNEAVRYLIQQRENKLDAYATARDRFRVMESELTVLTGLEAELTDLKMRQFNNRQMITAFSPEKGVLSRYIYNSVVRITDLMNKYIGAVWNYPMQVLPCDVTEGDMDYTFPYVLNNQPEQVPDVCKGSKAQKSIFNLAYRLTAYKALNLHGYPLLLDEPSEGMDEEHRHALVGFIKMLINSGEFSQVIVVSHDADVHSKLNEAAYCVIEPTGVTLPPVYNTGVKIVYAE